MSMLDVEISVKGQIDASWSAYLRGLRVSPTPDGQTVLSGRIRDQADVYGLLTRLSSLGLQLISVAVRSASLPAGEEGRNM